MLLLDNAENVKLRLTIVVTFIQKAPCTSFVCFCLFCSDKSLKNSIITSRSCVFLQYCIKFCDKNFQCLNAHNKNKTLEGAVWVTFFFICWLVWEDTKNKKGPEWRQGRNDQSGLAVVERANRAHIGGSDNLFGNLRLPFKKGSLTLQSFSVHFGKPAN